MKIINNDLITRNLKEEGIVYEIGFEINGDVYTIKHRTPIKYGEECWIGKQPEENSLDFVEIRKDN